MDVYGRGGVLGNKMKGVLLSRGSDRNQDFLPLWTIVKEENSLLLVSPSRPNREERNGWEGLLRNTYFNNSRSGRTPVQTHRYRLKGNEVFDTEGHG